MGTAPHKSKGSGDKTKAVAERRYDDSWVAPPSRPFSRKVKK
jgi:hypothetical protein